MTQVDGTLSRFRYMCLTRLLYWSAILKQCADPRDKIYGLLGLAPTEFARRIKVDYGPGTTAVNVYQMATIAHAAVFQRLEHFHNCFTPKHGRKIGDGPSWVPYFVSACPGETYIPSQFVAATSRAHNRYSERDRGILLLLGVQFGKVDHVTKAVPRGLDRWEAIRHVREWQPGDLDQAMYGPSGVSLRRAYAMTLICNDLKEHEPDWIVSSTEEWTQQNFTESLFGDDAISNEKEAGCSEYKPRQDVSDALQCCRASLFPDRQWLHGIGTLEYQAGRCARRTPRVSECPRPTPEWFGSRVVLRGWRMFRLRAPGRGGAAGTSTAAVDRMRGLGPLRSPCSSLCQ